MIIIKVSSKDDTQFFKQQITNFSTPNTHRKPSAQLTAFTNLYNGITNIAAQHNTGSNGGVTIDIKNTPSKSKIIVKSSLDSFDKIFKSVSSSLAHHHFDDPLWQAWNPEVTKQIEKMADSLKDESLHYQEKMKSTKFRDRFMRFTKLAFSSCTFFINSTEMNTSITKNINIALGVFVTFVVGLEEIFKFKENALLFAETSLSLDGLSRTLRSQLATPIQNRREPSELILFIETTRDKQLKKLVER